jgi:hypothetical protein
MKKLAAILCLSALATGAFAQGLVSFANGATTLISQTPPGGGAPTTLTAAPVGTYLYGLLISSSATGPFSFTSVYATNTAAGSKFGPATYNPTVTGWAAGTAMFYEVAGWSSNLGTTWNNAWLVNNSPAAQGAAVWGGVNGLFGLSSIANGTATAAPAPAFPLFGGTGLGGFALNSVVGVPEPGSMALAGLGAAALLIFRRRK